MNITERLFELSDEDYRVFTAGLIPNAVPDKVIGVRFPALRILAKELAHGGAEEFLSVLPHYYHDENLLHALIINGIGGYDEAIEQIDRFLPFVGNWAVCDTLKPKAFKKHRPELLGLLPRYLGSEHAYTVRFGLSMLMAHFLDEDFSPSVLDMAFSTAEARCGQEYYIDMMAAWFFATALAKQYDAALPYAERLPQPVRKMTVRKACESFRVTDKHKAEIKARCSK